MNREFRILYSVFERNKRVTFYSYFTDKAKISVISADQAETKNTKTTSFFSAQYRSYKIFRTSNNYHEAIDIDEKRES